MDARRKRLRYGAGRAAGPPTPPGYGIPTHHPMPKSLMNAKFLAEVYLNRIREHENVVKKTVRTNAQGLERPHCQFTLICSLAQKYINVNYQFDHMGATAQDFLQVSLPVACTLGGHPRGATPELANEKGEVFTNAWNIQQLRSSYP